MSTSAVVAGAAVGLVAGALVPLPAYRLSVAFEAPTRTTCVCCGQSIGLAALPARCARCGVRLGPPAWLTAGCAAVAGGALAAALGPTAALPLYVALAVLGVLLGAVDLACRRLPNVLVLPAIAVALAAFVILAAATGAWNDLLRALAGAAVLGSVFLLIYLVPGGGLGFGDVKLAALLGIFLGWLGWRAVALGALLPWLVNAPVVIGLLAARRVGRRSALPFGPAMLTGALAAIIVSAWLDVVGRP